MKKKPVGRTPKKAARQKRQSIKERYAKAREDAQLAGVIFTRPEGAVRDEVVNPATQSEQQIPSIDRMAALGEAKGWQVPEAAKQLIVKRLIEPFTQEPEVVYDDKGNSRVIPPDRHLLKENAKVLVTMDKHQWERDNPVEAGKSRGASNVTQQTAVVVDPLTLYKQLQAEVKVDEAEEEIKALEERAAQVPLPEPAEVKEKPPQWPPPRKGVNGQAS